MEPPASASPMVPISRPRPAAARPLSATRPASTATIDRPRIEIISISGRPKDNTMGRATTMNNVRKAAPTSPPKSDEVKAAESARAAWPFLAMGKPSSTVAWLAEEPGMPMRTEAKVSEVGTTATMPIISARPSTGSMPNMKGKSRDNPAIPPRPGKTPTARPMTTPNTRYPSTTGCKIRAHAWPSAGRAVANRSIAPTSKC